MQTLGLQSLVVVKPALEMSGTKKWEFMWNGMRLSAYMGDFDFLGKLQRHECLFGINDVITADLELHQKKNAQGVMQNRKVIITKVHRLEQMNEQTSLKV